MDSQTQTKQDRLLSNKEALELGTQLQGRPFSRATLYVWIRDGKVESKFNQEDRSYQVYESSLRAMFQKKNRFAAPPNQEDVPPGTKWRKCTSCGQSWPLTADYWNRHPSSYVEGYHTICKSCRGQATRRDKEAGNLDLSKTTRVIVQTAPISSARAAQAVEILIGRAGFVTAQELPAPALKKKLLVTLEGDEAKRISSGDTNLVQGVVVPIATWWPEEMVH